MQSFTNCAQDPRPNQLLEIIEIQSEIVRQGLNLDLVMQVVVERSMSITGATGAVVEISDTATNEMVYRAVSGSATGQLGLRLPIATSLSGLCATCAEPLYCEDSELDPRVDRNACRKVGLRSMVCVPLFYDNKAVGVLKVLSSRPHQFGAGDVVVLGVVSQIPRKDKRSLFLSLP